jgi:hypothetical protein
LQWALVARLAQLQRWRQAVTAARVATQRLARACCWQAAAVVVAAVRSLVQRAVAAVVEARAVWALLGQLQQALVVFLAQVA